MIVQQYDEDNGYWLSKYSDVLSAIEDWSSENDPRGSIHSNVCDDIEKISEYPKYDVVFLPYKKDAKTDWD